MISNVPVGLRDCKSGSLGRGYHTDKMIAWKTFGIKAGTTNPGIEHSIAFNIWRKNDVAKRTLFYLQ